MTTQSMKTQTQPEAGELLKTKMFRVTCDQTGEEKTFETRKEIEQWAASMTMTFQSDLTFEVAEVVETTRHIHASYKTGEVGACI